MTEAEIAGSLGRIYVLLHRSLGQYLDSEAWLVYDMGEKAAKAINLAQRNDAERVGQFLFNLTGYVYEGTYDMKWSDLHFLNLSKVLPEWIAAEEKLIAELDDELVSFAHSEGAGAKLARDVVKNEKNRLEKLKTLASQIPTAV